MEISCSYQRADHKERAYDQREKEPNEPQLSVNDFLKFIQGCFSKKLSYIE